jgi:hypothetical protein
VNSVPQDRHFLETRKQKAWIIAKKKIGHIQTQKHTKRKNLFVSQIRLNFVANLIK